MPYTLAGLDSKQGSLANKKTLPRIDFSPEPVVLRLVLVEEGVELGRGLELGVEGRVLSTLPVPEGPRIQPPNLTLEGRGGCSVTSSSWTAEVIFIESGVFSSILFPISQSIVRPRSPLRRLYTTGFQLSRKKTWH